LQHILAKNSFDFHRINIQAVPERASKDAKITATVFITNNYRAYQLRFLCGKDKKCRQHANPLLSDINAILGFSGYF
jgi:hypothetical protein